MDSFFAKDGPKIILETFLRKLYSLETVKGESIDRFSSLANIRKVIENISNHPQGWDQHCPFNINYIGDQFLDILNRFDPNTEEKLARVVGDILLFCYRFLCEYSFSLDIGRELNPELESVKMRIQQAVTEADDEMTNELRSNFVWATYIMPAQLTKYMIGHENILSIKSFNKKIEEADKLKTQWDKDIAEKEKEVTRLAGILAEQKDAFNFVGLSKGFGNLLQKKENQASMLLGALMTMAVLIILPLIGETIYALVKLSDDALTLMHLAIFIPVISIEIILIYFFRIILLQHRSVTAQKMQLELRQTLCQFIQNYSEYSVKLKEKDKTALEKFENLIFSGILADSERLPSTFDGLDQITNLLKSVKG